MPMPSGLVAGSEWRQKIALSIFPWLLALAKTHRRAIWYSEIDAEIVARGIHNSTFATNYGDPLGSIGDALKEISASFGHDVPPLNALVVGKEEGIPGHGCQQYILRYRNASSAHWDLLTLDDKRAITEEVHEDIFTYPYWDRVEAYFADVLSDYPHLSAFDGQFQTELHSMQQPRPKRDSSRSVHTINPNFFPTERHGSGESEHHKTLKHWVAKHPEVVGLPTEATAQIEKVYGSGDQVDVEFNHGSTRLAVEVKSKISTDEDIIRGVFQCVKYRYLCRAHQKLDNLFPTGDAVLVVARSCSRLVREYAKQLKVRIIEVAQPIND